VRSLIEGEMKEYVKECLFCSGLLKTFKGVGD